MSCWNCLWYGLCGDGHYFVCLQWSWGPNCWRLYFFFLFSFFLIWDKNKGVCDFSTQDISSHESFPLHPDPSNNPNPDINPKTAVAAVCPEIKGREMTCHGMTLCTSRHKNLKCQRQFRVPWRPRTTVNFCLNFTFNDKMGHLSTVFYPPLHTISQSDSTGKFVNATIFRNSDLR